VADLLLIVNPGSAVGTTGRRWPQIEERLKARLPSFDVALTQGPGHATTIAAESAGRYERIGVVGGDGTNNEVLNGLVCEDRPVDRNVVLGFIPRGTGADFARGLSIPSDVEAAAERLVDGEVREVDVGKVVYRTHDGVPTVRYFLNEASIGMGALVCERVNRRSKVLGGALSYLWATLATGLRYRDKPVAFSFGSSDGMDVLLNNAWVANGRYSGGGIMSAPRAEIDDGLLDVVCIPHMSLLHRVAGLIRLRSGSFIEMPEVSYRTAPRVDLRSQARVYIETDGEPIGMLPATFEALSGRLKIVA
jgi:diacylglycerol kinase (ATP)